MRGLADFNGNPIAVLAADRWKDEMRELKMTKKQLGDVVARMGCFPEKATICPSVCHVDVVSSDPIRRSM